MSSSEYSFSGDDDDGAASSSSEEVIPTTKRRFGGINSDDDDGEEEEAGKSNVGKGIIEDGKKEEQQNKRQKKGQLAASVPVVFVRNCFHACASIVLLLQNVPRPCLCGSQVLEIHLPIPPAVSTRQLATCAGLVCNELYMTV